MKRQYRHGEPTALGGVVVVEGDVLVHGAVVVEARA